MEIKRSGSQPSAKGPAEWFTGAVRVDPAVLRSRIWCIASLSRCGDR